MMRIVLFLCTNLSVLLLFGFVLSLIGFKFNYVFQLMMMAGMLGVGGSLVSLYFSKSIALSSVNGKIITISSNEMEEWLLNVIHNQSRALGMVTPKLAIYNSLNMNAFATGTTKKDSLIALSSNLVKNMSKRSIEAVVAHEINHINSGDMVTMTLIQGIINMFIIFISHNFTQLIMYYKSFFMNSNIDDNDDMKYYNNNNGEEHCVSGDVNISLIYTVVTSILELLFGLIANIIVLWFSRYREFYADAGAATLVGCDKMIDALKELQVNDNLNEVERLNKNIQTLFIHCSLKNKCRFSSIYNNMMHLFSSHPPLSKRIKALETGMYLNK